MFGFDLKQRKIWFEYLKDCQTAKDYLLTHNDFYNIPQVHTTLVNLIANSVAEMHSKGVIHGDLTTSNMMIRVNANDEIADLYLIDFGLSQFSNKIEDKAVDLYVLK